MKWKLYIVFNTHPDIQSLNIKKSVPYTHTHTLDQPLPHKASYNLTMEDPIIQQRPQPF